MIRVATVGSVAPGSLGVHAGVDAIVAASRTTNRVGGGARALRVRACRARGVGDRGRARDTARARVVPPTPARGARAHRARAVQRSARHRERARLGARVEGDARCRHAAGDLRVPGRGSRARGAAQPRMAPGGVRFRPGRCGLGGGEPGRASSRRTEGRLLLSPDTHHPLALPVHRRATAIAW